MRRKDVKKQILEMDKSRNMDGHHTKMCPGQELVSNEYPSIRGTKSFGKHPFETDV